MKIRWADPALADVEAIGDYIARDNPPASQRIVSRIFDQTDVLAEHPHIGRAGRVAGTRELVISNTSYIVAYQVHENETEILAVIHGARAWPESFQ